MRKRGNVSVCWGGRGLLTLGNIMYVGSEHLLNEDRWYHFFCSFVRFVCDVKKGREGEWGQIKYKSDGFTKRSEINYHYTFSLLFQQTIHVIGVF